MTKREIIKKIGLDNYYSNQELANEILLKNSKETLEDALKVYELKPTNATREFISRVLTGIFEIKKPINEIR